MNPQITLLQKLKLGDFNSCLDLISTNTLNFPKSLKESNILFAKKEHKWLRQAFWQSDLAKQQIHTILSSKYKKDLLEPFYRHNEPMNKELPLRIWQIDSNLFMTLFKRFKCYKKTAWIKALKDIEISLVSHKKLPLKIFIYESITLHELDQEIILDEQNDYEKLLGIPIDKVLFGVCCRHEMMMQNTKIKGNNDLKMQLDMALVNEFDSILKYLCKQKTDSLFNTIYSTEDPLQENWEKYRPNHKSEKKGRKPLYDQDLEIIKNIFDNGIKRQKKRFARDAYLAGYGSFDPSYGILSIKYNAKFKQFKINNSKSQQEESYFFAKYACNKLGLPISEFSSEKLLMEDTFKQGLSNNIAKELRTGRSVYTWLDILSFYRIPTILPTSNINIELAIKILGIFCQYKAPESRFFFDFFFNNKEESILVNKGDDKFRVLFGGNTAISIFDYEELETKIVEYFNCNLITAKETLAFLTFDLNKVSNISHYLHRPFIKINQQVYWLGRLLKDRRWDTLLRNKIKEDKTYLEKNTKEKLTHMIAVPPLN